MALGQAIERELQGRVGNPQLKPPMVEKFPPLQPEGKTRDLVAKQLGFGSGKTPKVGFSGTPIRCAWWQTAKAGVCPSAFQMPNWRFKRDFRTSNAKG